MLNKILKHLVAALVLSFVLLAVGVVIWYFMKDSGTVLQDVLFWIGAIPIAFITVRMLGGFIGRADTSYQLSRSVSSRSPNQRALQDASEIKNLVRSELIWFMAAVLIWLYIYFPLFYST